MRLWGEVQFDQIISKNALTALNASTDHVRLAYPGTLPTTNSVERKERCIRLSIPSFPHPPLRCIVRQ